MSRVIDVSGTVVKDATDSVAHVKGDDPQRWLMLPITVEEVASLADAGKNVGEPVIEQLGAGRRYLDADFPKGGPSRIVWAAGGFFVSQHD